MPDQHVGTAVIPLLDIFLEGRRDVGFVGAVAVEAARIAAERGRGLLDLTAHRFADMGGVVECARHRLGGDPRDARNIDDR